MKKILFSTPLQKEKYFSNVKKLLNSRESLHGPGKNILSIKKQLKNQFKFKHIHLTHSCTAAMEMCALMLNLKKDDEVLMPSYNYITTGSSFVRAGCKLRYCDIDKNNLNAVKNEAKRVNTILIIR